MQTQKQSGGRVAPKFPEQAAEIGRIARKLGVEPEDLAPRIAVERDTMRKISRGYQKAGPQVMQSLRVLEEGAGGYRFEIKSPQAPPPLEIGETLERLEYLHSRRPEAFAVVAAMIKAAYDQAKMK